MASPLVARLRMTDSSISPADGSAGPTRGVLRATASARASGISLLDGLLTVASVDVHGASQTDGRPGGASSRAVVDIEGVTAAGTTFDVRAGALVVGDRELPLDGGAAQAFLRTVSAALGPSLGSDPGTPVTAHGRMTTVAAIAVNTIDGAGRRDSTRRCYVCAL